MIERDDIAASGAAAIESVVPGRRKRGRAVEHVHKPRRSYELRLKHIWMYRRTIPLLGWGFVRMRFQGMWLGWLWLPLRPALQMLSRGFVFGGMLHLGSGNRPYIIFLMVGQASWDFFDKIVYYSFRTMRSQRRYMGGIPIPWAAAVSSTTVFAAFDAMTFIAIGAIASVYYKVTQGSFYISLNVPNALWLVVGVALLTAWAIALALVVAPVIVKVRDLRYVIRYAISFWYFLTPVLYSISSIPPAYRGFATYNPITAPIELIKNALLGTGAPANASLVVSVAGLFVALPIGLMVCAYMERPAHARI